MITLSKVPFLLNDASFRKEDFAKNDYVIWSILLSMILLCRAHCTTNLLFCFDRLLLLNWIKLISIHCTLNTPLIITTIIFLLNGPKLLYQGSVYSLFLHSLFSLSDEMKLKWEMTSFLQSHLPITETFWFCLIVYLYNMFPPSTGSC
jgi:hypothetical protein